jgi:magnesium transporter
MLHVYANRGDALKAIDVDDSGRLPEDVVWIDLLEPTREEEQVVERWMNIEIPTREEMREIEASSRVYEADDALYMNVNLLARVAEGLAEVSSATFVLSQTKLVTVRYFDPMPFKNYLAHSVRQVGHCATGAAVCAGLMEAIVDRLADILENIGADIDAVSKLIFARDPERGRERDFTQLLNRIGHNEDMAAKARDSLTTIARVVAYLTQVAKTRGSDTLRSRFKSLHEDIVSLNDYLAFMSGKLSFVLDATLGMISIEQNQVMKVFTIFMVVTTPPIVIAGIYGMNFKVMPELSVPWAYPVVLLVMLITAVVPYWWIRRRGWL